jgi:3'-5' exoribonuclease|nr:MAG TPA: putative HD superfamily hydrolase [Caudoviricetes sp.]
MYVNVTTAEIRKTKTGKDYYYLQVRTGDSSFVLYVWDPIQEFKTGEFLQIETVNVSGDFTSANSSNIKKVKKEEIPEDDLIHKLKLIGDYDSDGLWNYWNRLITDTIIDPLEREFLLSDNVKKSIEKYGEFAAGKRMHHAFKNGLSSHTVEVLETCFVLTEANYISENLDRFVLFYSALLHDFGKIYEYTNIDKNTEYTENMFLMGHIYISSLRARTLLQNWVSTLPEDKKAAGKELFKKSKFIEHCILAHHGKKEFGSPVVPATKEALILHYADEISRKLQSFESVGNMEKSFMWDTYIIKN